LDGIGFFVGLLLLARYLNEKIVNVLSHKFLKPWEKGFVVLNEVSSYDKSASEITLL
jgi:hypothetical protein